MYPSSRHKNSCSRLTEKNVAEGFKNARNSVESRLLEDEFCCLLVLLCYFFVWNTNRVLYVIMYLRRKNCKERQAAHLSFRPV